MKICHHVSIAVLTAVMLVAPVRAQEPSTDTLPAADDPIATQVAEPASKVVIQGAEPAATPATKSTGDSGGDTLSVDFPDEDIRNILRNVADLFELNLVVPDTLQGRTSIKLRDVTWKQIFQVVLKPVGFTYIEDGNIIKVVSNDSLQQEPATTEVFILNYARADDILPTLASLVDPAVGGKIVVDSRSNALVITERPSRMNRIRPIITALDKATAQVMIESKFVEVTDSDIKNIGVNWSSLSGMQVGVGGINQQWSRSRGQQSSSDFNKNNGSTSNTTSTSGNNSTNNGSTVSQTGFSTNPVSGGAPSSVTFPDGTVTLDDPNTKFSTVTGAPTIQAEDKNGNPVLLNLPINTVNSSNNGTTGSNVSDISSNGATGAINSLFGLTNTGGTSRLASAVFSASDFNIILSALKTQNDTKLVSNPTVVTLNNSEAVINIGKEYPIPSYTYNQERGTYEVSGFEYRPIGIILKVTPQVNSRGFIKLNIEPEVSSSNESTTFGSATIPIVTTRKTKTQVSLRDGYTMGIGGLIENSSSVGQTRVPVLGSIPILGRLFRSDSKNTNTRNLIIFITAKTVDAEGASIEEVFDSRRVRQLKMKRSDLPGYRDGSDPFLPDEPTVKTEKQ